MPCLSARHLTPMTLVNLLSMCQCSSEAWALATSITRKNEARAAAAAASPPASQSPSVRGSMGGGPPVSPGAPGAGGAANAGGSLGGSLGGSSVMLGGVDIGIKRVASNSSMQVG